MYKILKLSRRRRSMYVFVFDQNKVGTKMKIDISCIQNSCATHTHTQIISLESEILNCCLRNLKRM